MKRTQNKKGFSLIELIIVIAVIAAIAAVIVPSIGNFSSSAKNAADQRNVQTWNSIYMNIHSIYDNGNGVSIDSGTFTTIAGPDAESTTTTITYGKEENETQYVPDLSATYTLAGAANTLSSSGFNIEGTQKYYFSPAKGLVDTETADEAADEPVESN